MRLTPEQISQYRSDGATVVRGAFSSVQMKLLERGIERNMRSPSPLAVVASSVRRQIIWNKRQPEGMEALAHLC